MVILVVNLEFNECYFIPRLIITCTYFLSDGFVKGFTVFLEQGNSVQMMPVCVLPSGEKKSVSDLGAFFFVSARMFKAEAVVVGFVIRRWCYRTRNCLM